MNIGKQIRIKREEKRMTQGELAAMLNTTQQVISHYEKDETGNLSIGRISEIAEALNVSIQELLGLGSVVVNNENGHNIVNHSSLHIQNVTEHERQAYLDLIAQLKTENQRLVNLLEK